MTAPRTPLLVLTEAFSERTLLADHAAALAELALAALTDAGYVVVQPYQGDVL